MAGGRPAWAAEARRLAARRDVVILAGNYQSPVDAADRVGDSLALARLAAAGTGPSPRTIMVAGVCFMAETAKILSPGAPC